MANRGGNAGVFKKKVLKISIFLFLCNSSGRTDCSMCTDRCWEILLRATGNDDRCTKNKWQLWRYRNWDSAVEARWTGLYSVISKSYFKCNWFRACHDSFVRVYRLSPFSRVAFALGVPDRVIWLSTSLAGIKFWCRLCCMAFTLLVQSKMFVYIKHWLTSYIIIVLFPERFMGVLFKWLWGNQSNCLYNYSAC